MSARTKAANTNRSDAITRGSGNVFEDLGFEPRQALELQTKAALTLQIYRRIKKLGLTQLRAAERLNLSQPDVSKLMGGRHTGFSIDRLLALLSALEVDIDIVLRPKNHGRRFRRGTVRVTQSAAA